ncbi:hypothetical protein KI387_010940, partial [Taxus chinensis]
SSGKIGAMTTNGQNAKKTETSNRSSDEERRSYGDSTLHGGGASRGIWAPVDDMSTCREGWNSCPNQQPCKEKLKIAVGHALGGFSEAAKGNTRAST